MNENTVFTGGLINPTGCITVDGGEIRITMVWEGFEEMANPAGNTCGANIGKYGADDEKRQIIAVSTFITDE